MNDIKVTVDNSKIKSLLAAQIAELDRQSERIMVQLKKLKEDLVLHEGSGNVRPIRSRRFSDEDRYEETVGPASKNLEYSRGVRVLEDDLARLTLNRKAMQILFESLPDEGTQETTFGAIIYIVSSPHTGVLHQFF